MESNKGCGKRKRQPNTKYQNDSFIDGSTINIANVSLPNVGSSSGVDSLKSDVNKRQKCSTTNTNGPKRATSASISKDMILGVTENKKFLQ